MYMCHFDKSLNESIPNGECRVSMSKDYHRLKWGVNRRCQPFSDESRTLRHEGSERSIWDQITGPTACVIGTSSILFSEFIFINDILNATITVVSRPGRSWSLFLYHDRQHSYSHNIKYYTLHAISNVRQTFLK